MRKIKDLTGQRFGKLVVIEYAGTDKNHSHMWKCKCDCGQYVVTRGSRLIHGNAKSCGCLKHVSHRKGKTFISHEDRTLKSILTGMKTRCNNPNSPHYKYYGGRGITVCEEWQHVDKFREWAYNNGYKPGLTIDRIDVNGNYEPSNCRWVTMQEQSYNRTDNHLITYKGETKCLVEWANQLGIPYDTLRVRINKLHWSIEKTLTTPARKLNRKKN